MDNDLIETRRAVAKILVDVILGKIKVLDALKNFPKNSDDDSVNTCFHILVHYESDEELRKKDQLYKETQDDFLVETAEILLSGNSLPINIINEYKDYYKSDLIYKKMTKENIIKRLGKFINIWLKKWKTK